MSDQGAEQDRSEAPTEHKLRRARQKGSVARGVDLGFAISLAALIGWALIQLPRLEGATALMSRRALVAAFTVEPSPQALALVAGAAFSAVLSPLAFLAAGVFVLILAFEIVQTGFVFSTEPLRPDFSRLNPARTLKRLFSVRMLVETGKNILKLCVYGLVAWLVVKRSLVADPALGDARALAAALGRAGLNLTLAFAGLAALFAIFDQLIVRRDFTKQMRMSRRELKRESKDREGDPRLKQRRKQLHAEFVMQSKSLRAVRGADILITNPTHYAVALKYEPAKLDAPVVVSRGMNDFAQRLKRLAFIYGVATVEDRELARALFHGGQLDQPVPDQHFARVADHYLALRTRRRRQTEDAADV